MCLRIEKRAHSASAARHNLRILLVDLLSANLTDANGQRVPVTIGKPKVSSSSINSLNGGRSKYLIVVQVIDVAEVEGAVGPSDPYHPHS